MFSPAIWLSESASIEEVIEEVKCYKRQEIGLSNEDMLYSYLWGPITLCVCVCEWSVEKEVVSYHILSMAI